MTEAVKSDDIPMIAIPRWMFDRAIDTLKAHRAGTASPENSDEIVLMLEDEAAIAERLGNGVPVKNAELEEVRDVLANKLVEDPPQTDKLEVVDPLLKAVVQPVFAKTVATEDPAPIETDPTPKPEPVIINEL